MSISFDSKYGVNLKFYLQGVPIMIRIGAADRTVHPYYTRCMFRLLRQQQSNVTYSELADKEHWWWDTYKTNDGGVVNDPVIRNFAVSHAGNAGKPSSPASKACASLIFSTKNLVNREIVPENLVHVNLTFITNEA